MKKNVTVQMTTAFAAGWTMGQGENRSRWWYDLGNGQYYGTADQTVEWQWLDGNGDGIAECYAFDSQGWMYAGTVTPDSYTVNADGAWTEDGVVQTMAAAAGYAGTRAQEAAGETGTSGGSSIGESMPDIRAIAGARGASVGTGLTANSLSESTIRNWLNENGVR